MASVDITEEETVQIPVSTVCDLCDSEVEVNSFCRNCAQKICDVCKKSHLRSTQSRDHIVVHISEGPCLTDEPIICQEHRITFTFYCRTCGTLSCLKCLVKKHKGHDFVDTDGYADEIRTKSTNLISQTQREKAQKEQEISDIERAQEAYLKKMSETKKSVQNVAKELGCLIEQIEKRLLSVISKKESKDLAVFGSETDKRTEEVIQTAKTLQRLKHDSQIQENILLIQSTKTWPGKACKTAGQNVLSVVPIIHAKSSDNPDQILTKLFELFGSLQPGATSPQNKGVAEELRRESWKCGCEKRFPYDYDIYEKRSNRCRDCAKRLR